VRKIRKPRGVPVPDIKTLWSKAHGCCSHPDCRATKSLLLPPTEQGDPNAVLGEMSHIVAYSDDGPRGDPSVPEKERDRYPNLILLCPDHHTMIDKQPNSAPSAEIRKWKEDWEAEAGRAIAETVALVPPAELKLIADYLIQQLGEGGAEGSSDIVSPTPLGEKLIRNELSAAVSAEIARSLARRDDVHRFIVHQEKMIRAYPEKLREGFVSEYNRLHQQGSRGDGLYYALRAYACQNSKESDRIAAAAVILAYYFEICEVFVP
jgi:hypothetical protein